MTTRAQELTSVITETVPGCSDPSRLTAAILGPRVEARQPADDAYPHYWSGRYLDGVYIYAFSGDRGTYYPMGGKAEPIVYSEQFHRERPWMYRCCGPNDPAPLAGPKAVPAVAADHKAAVLVTTAIDIEEPDAVPPRLAPEQPDARYTPTVDRILAAAVAEARALHHHHVGTEHLLLAMCREPASIGGDVLTRFPGGVEGVRRAVLELVGADEPVERNTVGDPAGLAPPTVRPVSFSDRARKVMALANQEAQRFNHEYIGTEHILLGLVKEGSGVGANVLKNVGVDLRKVRLEVEKLVKSGPDAIIMGKLPLTSGAQRAVDYALRVATDYQNTQIGTEHLLLGLTVDVDSIAAKAIVASGTTLSAIRVPDCRDLATRSTAFDIGRRYARTFAIGPRHRRSCPLDQRRCRRGHGRAGRDTRHAQDRAGGGGEACVRWWPVEPDRSGVRAWGGGGR